MASFSVQPREHPATDTSVDASATDARRPPAWREPMRWAWGAAAFVTVSAAVWCWLISTPGAHVLVQLPFVALVLVATATVLWTSAAWLLDRRADPPKRFDPPKRSDPPLRIPWPAALVAVVLLLTVLGTRADVSVRARFATNRDELTALATGAPAPAVVSVAPGFLRYRSVAVETIPGGTMVVTGGHPVAHGFVYLPDPADVERWDGATSLRPLGGGWYLTV